MDKQAHQEASAQASHSTDGHRFDKLRAEIQHAAHLLPAQGPITAFVHHNTLHAFEELPFEAAVVEGGKTFGCHPFLPEEQYRRKLTQRSIRPEDLQAVLADDLGDRADELLGFLGTRASLRQAMLEHPLQTGPSVELRWYVAETDALRRFRAEAASSSREHVLAQTRHWVMRDLRNGDVANSPNKQLQEAVGLLFQTFDKETIEHWSEETWQAFTLHALWLACVNGAKAARAVPSEGKSPLRHADLLRQAVGESSDPLVHDLLIRFCAAFLDQGFAAWPLRDRDRGFYRTFLTVYSQSCSTPDIWMRGVRKDLARLLEQDISPLDSIVESFDALGVGEDETGDFITQTLLALRGYAGMIWQLESRGDRVAHPAPANSLIEYLAVRLVLERHALAWQAKETVSFAGPLTGLRKFLREKIKGRDARSSEQRAFGVFQLAQLLGWEPATLWRLSQSEWSALMQEIEAFDGLERRRIYHLAFERRYRNQTLDAVALHCERVSQSQASEATDVNTVRRPKFQLVCCIDEREESFRRHLEELAPECETFGVAGFFAVAMYYRGAADAHYTPLCPVIIRPQHYVSEDVVYTFEEHARRRRRRRRTIGTVTHHVHMGSRTFAGGWFAALFGSLASLPLVMRILFPRATAQLRKLVGDFVRTPEVTQLQLERTEEAPGPEDGHVGYSVDEMAGIVERLLRDMGLTRDFSRLIVIC
ncbi:MAG: DUF2309 family protein, partial [Planctomycetales bacterium]|nr:DUF2309 family protein [Planctomycetales bacterium]